MTAVDLIFCPYDLGRRNWRCGLGPGRILESGAIARLTATGHDVGLVDIEAAVAYESESEPVFEVQRQRQMNDWVFCSPESSGNERIYPT